MNKRKAFAGALALVMSVVLVVCAVQGGWWVLMMLPALALGRFAWRALTQVS